MLYYICIQYTHKCWSTTQRTLAKYTCSTSATPNVPIGFFSPQKRHAVKHNNIVYYYNKCVYMYLYIYI